MILAFAFAVSAAAAPIPALKADAKLLGAVSAYSGLAALHEDAGAAFTRLVQTGRKTATPSERLAGAGAFLTLHLAASPEKVSDLAMDPNTAAYVEIVAERLERRARQDPATRALRDRLRALDLSGCANLESLSAKMREFYENASRTALFSPSQPSRRSPR